MNKVKHVFTNISQTVWVVLWTHTQVSDVITEKLMNQRDRRSRTQTLHQSIAKLWSRNTKSLLPMKNNDHVFPSLRHPRWQWPYCYHDIVTLSCLRPGKLSGVQCIMCTPFYFCNVWIGDFVFDDRVIHRNVLVTSTICCFDCFSRGPDNRSSKTFLQIQSNFFFIHWFRKWPLFDYGKKLWFVHLSIGYSLDLNGVINF